MNIRAKIDPETPPQSNDSGVNQPLGEAYSSYWDAWLKGFSTRLVAPGRSVCAQPQTNMSPLDTIHSHCKLHGNGPVFDLARISGPIGFDLINFVLMSSPDSLRMAERWRKLVRYQVSVRSSGQDDPTRFLEIDDDNNVVLTPGIVRPANLSTFGPAMLAGVAIGAFQRLHRQKVQVLEIMPNGRSRPLNLRGNRQTGDIAFDSQILIRFGRDLTPTNGSVFPLSAPNLPLSLAHLGTKRSDRFLEKVAAVMPRESGCHRPLEDTARLLGMSARSLSRRLSEEGTAYGKLARFVRLRKACLLLSSGNADLNDIAFLSDYSDRHHMARDFRRMTQISPADVRDVMQG